MKMSNFAYMKNRCLIFLLVLVSFNSIMGQWKTQVLFPGDSSFILTSKLIDYYKPSVVLDYTNARVKMYTEIYNVHDTVSCVYSKHSLYLDPSSSDPIGYIFKSGSANGINCEHTFPQSKGAETGNARSDMHHLYPARAAVNEARLNYPFGDIDDKKTNHWFYKTQDLTLKPSKDVDEYSESINSVFEPREDHKGNVARAIFYFFTMYQLQSDAVFFESMRPTLCNWHQLDPVDSLEWTRTYMIAKYQDNKPNPFVLDCSLARRTFCNLNSSCTPSTNIELTESQIHLLTNPVHDELQIQISDFSLNLHSIQITDITGVTSYTFNPAVTDAKLNFDTNGLPSGCYILVIRTVDNKIWRRVFVKG